MICFRGITPTKKNGIKDEICTAISNNAFSSFFLFLFLVACFGTNSLQLILLPRAFSSLPTFSAMNHLKRGCSECAICGQ